MGGKAQRRREKNYKAAHGGNSRLPPPPNASSMDALPSKLRQLRKLMDLTNSSSQPDNKRESNPNNRRADKKKLGEKREITSLGREDKNENISSKVKDVDVDHASEDNLGTNEKRKKKRKRKEANDLRFQKLDELGVAGLRKKERKRKHREDMKSKKLNKKAKLEDGQGFATHENITFGEVVEAPPKILIVPKASRASHDASKERLRLKAIDEYRNRRGWVSRPGVVRPVLPPTVSRPNVSTK